MDPRVLCLLVGGGVCLIGVGANVAFPPGLSQGMRGNMSYHKGLRLSRIKELIGSKLSQFRGSVEPSKDPIPTEIPNRRGREQPKPLEPPTLLIPSGSAGKNLLSFQLDRLADPAESKVTQVNLWIHVWQKEKKKKKKQLRMKKKKKKGKLIHISVYNISSNENDVVATLRTRIQNTQWFRIPLPISLVSEIKSKTNDSIVLRVECKKCNRRTKLMLPHKNKCKLKTRKKKRKKRRRNNRKRQSRKSKSLLKLRKNCATARSSRRNPFIVIEQKYKGFERRKRSVTCNPSDMIYINGTVRSSRCCRISSYIHFSDLDFDDVIVTPAGFDASQCIGRCPRRRNRNSGQRRGRRDRNIRGNRPKRGKCRPVQTDPLTVWIFNRNHNLVAANLQDLVVRNCDCR